MSTKPRRLIILTIIAGLLAALVLFLFVSNRDLPEDRKTTIERGASEASPDAGRARTRSILEAPLPPLDLPLSATLDELVKRTQEGEADAACRLGAEYSYCSQLIYRRSEMADWLAERARALDSIDDPGLRESAIVSLEREQKLREDRLRQLENHCEGVRLPSDSAIADLWRTSAIRGNPTAIRQYASGNAFRWSNIIETLPELQTYRQEAEKMAISAAEKGDLDILLGLAAGYDPAQAETRSLLAQVLPADGAKSLAIYRHVQRALPESSGEERRLKRRVTDKILALEEGLSQADIARAAEIEAREIGRWDPPVLRGLGRLDTSGRLMEVSRGWCER